jgi:glutamine cyclotransferase
MIDIVYDEGQLHMKRMVRVILLVGLLVALLAAVMGSAGAQGGNPVYNPVVLLVPEVIEVRPHDPAAYLQGWLFYEGSLYESTGRNGQSTLREVDPETGDVLRKIDVPEEYFAEGLGLVDDQLIQLTWKAGTAFIYDLATFEQTGTFTYEGEGWGLCSDGRYLYMSDGSPFLDVRDPDTFELIFSGLVTLQGRMVEQINELECVGDYVYANVWHTDYIIQIDKTNGVVVGLVDASNLLTEEERAELEPEAVLNGIVYLPDSDTFLITGKLWPKMFEVRFVPAEQ